MKKLWEKFLCWIEAHDWTSKAGQGIKPSEEELHGGVAGFYRYAEMYCSRCPARSKLNGRW